MYIEFVIADNFALTFLAGAAATKLSHKRPEILRIFAAATAGTIAAVFYPYIRVGFWAQTAIKIGIGAALCVILFLRTARPITSSLMFFGCTFAFGGACYAVYYSVCTCAPTFGESVKECPMFLTLGIGTAVYFAIGFIIKRTRLARAREPYRYRADIGIFGRTLTFDAFLDTGNCVFDDKTGLPIVVTDMSVFTGKLDLESSRVFLKNVDRFRKEKIRTAAGETEIYILDPDKITVYSDKREHTLIAALGLAVCGKRVFSDYELLLSPAAVGEGI